MDSGPEFIPIFRFVSNTKYAMGTLWRPCPAREINADRYVDAARLSPKTK